MGRAIRKNDRISEAISVYSNRKGNANLARARRNFTGHRNCAE